MTVERICEVCGKKFLANYGNVQRGEGKFCSRDCRIAWTKQHPPRQRRYPGPKKIILLGILKYHREHPDLTLKELQKQTRSSNREIIQYCEKYGSTFTQLTGIPFLNQEA